MGGTASRAAAAEGAALFDPLLRRTPTSRRGRKRGVFCRAQRAVITRATRTGLLDYSSVAAVDATGLETRHVSLYFRVRCGIAQAPAHRRRSWRKLTAVVHTGSNLIVGAVTAIGPTQDLPEFTSEFTPAMRQAAGLVPFDTVLADAGYDAEHNQPLCRNELGICESVIALYPRNHGRRWPSTPYRRAMRQHFPRAQYQQRWQVESVFSRHKRRLGSALTTRRPASQQRETIL